MLRTVAVLALVGLAACNHSAREAAKCSEYGFEPGTDGYANCRMQMEQGRKAAAAVMAAGNPYLRP